MVMAPAVVWAQSGKQQIKGQVLDGQGVALIGVAVRNLTTSTGVITDLDGFYAIEAHKGETLEFSYVGYNTVKKEVGASASISIVMTEDVQALDEVVVVGMGTQRKASVIGSISSVRMADLKVPSRSLENALVGRMAGIIGRTGAGYFQFLDSRYLYLWGQSEPAGAGGRCGAFHDQHFTRRNRVCIYPERRFGYGRIWCAGC